MTDLFSEVPTSNFDSAISLITQCLRQLGVDPDEAKVSENHYVIKRGSAQIILMVERANEKIPQGALRAVAPIVHLPEDETQQTALLLHAMSLNGNGLGGAAFGVSKGAIVVLAERALLDLDGSEVEAIVRTVGAVADTYDDLFVQQFGARLFE